MAEEVKMPKFGETMTEGTIYKWIKEEGDKVANGDILFEVETDKATLEVESPAEGVLAKIIVADNESAEIGETVAIITAEGEELTELDESDYEEAADMEFKEEEVEDKEVADSEEIQEESDEILEENITNSKKIKASPAARRLAREKNISLADIKPGPGNDFIIEEDVVAAKLAVSDLSDKEVPLNKIRKITAEKMTASSQQAPHVTLTQEVDMYETVQIREKLKTISDYHITYTDIFIMAVARALKDYPEMNAHFQADTLYVKGNINVGMAIDTGESLVVPVIKNADKMGLEELVTVREELIEKAFDGKLNLDELEGGTFTVSNLGGGGVEIFTPIINLPEIAILGIGKIVEKAAVIDNEIVIRPQIWLSLSFDHRAVDGAPAARFLDRIRELLENPATMLL